MEVIRVDSLEIKVCADDVKELYLKIAKKQKRGRKRVYGKTDIKDFRQHSADDLKYQH